MDLRLRAILNSGLPSNGEFARGVKHFTTTSRGDAGIVQGPYVFFAVWSGPEDGAYASIAGPFIFLLKGRKKMRVIQTNINRDAQRVLMAA